MDQSASTSATGTKTLQQLNALVDRLVEQVQQQQQQQQADDEGDGGAAEVRSCFFELKLMHRQLFEKVQLLESEERSLAQRREKFQSKRSALECERMLLQRQIDAAKTFQTPFLEQLAKQQDREAALLAAINDKGVLNDPVQREPIVRQLHEEMNARARLEQTLKNQKEELKVVSEQLSAKRKFLKSLPDHLQAMERASLPVQKLVHANIPSTAATIGSERYERLQKARSLPPCLYTVFQQLQHWIDQRYQKTNAPNAAAATNTKITVAVVGAPPPTDDDPTNKVGDGEGQSSSMHVDLTLPIPDVANPAAATTTTTTPSKKKLHLQFYESSFSEDGGAGDEPQPSSLVSVVVAPGCANSVFTEVLLSELFPGDIGRFFDNTGTGRKSSIASFVSYQWSNYLGGIHVAGCDNNSDPSQQSGSTRVIMRELQRRTRSNATLKHILNSLQQRKIPSIPAEIVRSADDDDGNSSSTFPCQVVNFVTQTQKDGKDASNKESPTWMTYALALRKTGAPATSASSLKMTVRIHMARYPAVPPVWALSSDSSTGLYDPQLAQLEHKVNIELLQSCLSSSASSVTGAGIDNDIRADWILALQLSEIVDDWTSWDSGGIADGSSNAAARKRKRT